MQRNPFSFTTLACAAVVTLSACSGGSSTLSPQPALAPPVTTAPVAGAPAVPNSIPVPPAQTAAVDVAVGSSATTQILPNVGGIAAQLTFPAISTGATTLHVTVASGSATSQTASILRRNSIHSDAVHRAAFLPQATYLWNGTIVSPVNINATNGVQVQFDLAQLLAPVIARYGNQNHLGPLYVVVADSTWNSVQNLGPFALTGPNFTQLQFLGSGPLSIVAGRAYSIAVTANPAPVPPPAPVPVPAPSGPLLYATSQHYTTGTDEVVTFPLGSTGNVAPSTHLTGSQTGLNGPNGIAVDAAGFIYVANYGPVGGNGSVTVYAPLATGNVAPSRTIGGAASGLVHPVGIAVDSDGTIYVTDTGNSTVAAFAAGTSPMLSSTPIRRIHGSSTLLDLPNDVKIASTQYGSILVIADLTNTIDRTGAISTFSTQSNGNIAPLYTFADAGASNVATDAGGRLFVGLGALASSTGIQLFTLSSFNTTNPTPQVTLTGTATQLQQPGGLALDATGNLFVASATSGILIFDPTAFAGTNNAKSNVAPIRTIAGANTTLDFLGSVAVH